MLLKIFTLHGERGPLKIGLQNTERFYQADNFFKSSQENYGKPELIHFTGENANGEKACTVRINLVYEGYELLTKEGNIVRREVYMDMYEKPYVSETLKVGEFYEETYNSNHKPLECVEVFNSFFDITKNIREDSAIRQILSTQSSVSRKSLEYQWGAFMIKGDDDIYYRPAECMTRKSALVEE